MGGSLRRTLSVLLGVLLFAALLAPMWLCLHRSTSPNANDGSDRLFGFSIIGAMVVAEVLYAYAIYTLVVTVLL